MYISSALKNAGHDVSFINCHTPAKQVLPMPPEFHYLIKFAGGDKYHDFPFKNYCRFGMSSQEITRRLNETAADMYMISSLFTPYFQEAAGIISIIKNLNGDAVIAAGGYHAALYPEFFLNDCGINYVITGEGETSSVKLAEYISGKININDIPDLAYKEDSIIKRTGKISNDINEIIFPDRGLLKKRDIMAYKKIFLSMITSRGCPNRCEFCTGRAIWGTRYRTRDNRSIIAEIEECAVKYGADIINFEDDNLFHSGEKAAGFLQDIINLKKIIKKDIEFTAMNGISLENLDGDILALMKQAGFRELNISLVTFSGELQKKIGRPFDSDKFRLAAKTAKELGMNVRSYFILGLPDQTRREIEDTIDFLKGLAVRVFPSVFYNVNSPQVEWKMQRSSAFFNETRHLSRDDLIRYFHMASEGAG
ncbi:MAG: B12-binding domain-containing radical SAM protein [Spirochaetes bacterium]|nr:B12-binding domain-containing radical SAM protein [Spirochaetota bacterium]